MAVDKALSWTYTEDYIQDNEFIAAARALANELGAHAVSSGTGAVITMLTASCGARTVAEIGTGTGVSGLYILAGMAADGVLTTIDEEPEFHVAARRVFSAAGAGSPRTRLISGHALAILPRMAARAYDLVMINSEPTQVASYIENARRMLRPGGLVLVSSALWHDRVADPARRDEDTVAMRECVRQLLEDEDFLPALLPCGDGLLVGVRR